MVSGILFPQATAPPVDWPSDFDKEEQPSWEAARRPSQEGTAAEVQKVVLPSQEGTDAMDTDQPIAASSTSPLRSAVPEPVPKRTRVSDLAGEEAELRDWEERPDPPTQVLPGDGALP